MSEPPVHWPSMGAEEALEEWNSLRVWVAGLAVRYPNSVRLPDCWWRHPDLVELLAALRDHERGSFAPNALPTAAIEWHRALRDVEQRLDITIRRLPCAVPGRGHPRVLVNDAVPAGWTDFVNDDAARRDAGDVNPRPL